MQSQSSHSVKEGTADCIPGITTALKRFLKSNL